MDEKRGRGRPPKGDEAKRHAIGIRTTKELKERIEREAAHTGRSVAQEVERRLERSFEADDFAGGRETRALLSLLAGAIGFAERRTGHGWTEDYLTWALVEEIVGTALADVRPPYPAEKYGIHSEHVARAHEAADAAERAHAALSLFCSETPGAEQYLTALRSDVDAPANAFGLSDNEAEKALGLSMALADAKAEVTRLWRIAADPTEDERLAAVEDWRQSPLTKHIRSGISSLKTGR